MPANANSPASRTSQAKPAETLLRRSEERADEIGATPPINMFRGSGSESAQSPEHSKRRQTEKRRTHHRRTLNVTNKAVWQQTLHTGREEEIWGRGQCGAMLGERGLPEKVAAAKGDCRKSVLSRESARPGS